jgi:proline iminopeptidase
MTNAACEARVPLESGSLFVREIGEGRPIVVLHGGPDFDHCYLLPELDRLAESCRLIYYDQRGRGRSAPETRPEDVTLESEMDDLSRVAEHFGLASFALLGHSWGALLAMEYATRHPHRVSRLILLNSAPATRRDLSRLREERRKASGEDLKKMAALSGTASYRAGDLEAEAEYYRIHFRTTLSPERMDTVIERLRRHFTARDVLRARAIERRLYTQTWESAHYDLLIRLGGLSIPTLVIHGDADFIPASCAENIARAIPGARLVVLEGCGHFSYLDCPDEVATLVTQLLNPASGPPPLP